MKTDHSEIKVGLGRANQSGRCAVRLRVSFRGERQDLYLGFSVEPEKWDDRKEKVKHGSTIAGVSYVELNKLISKAIETVEAFFDDVRLRHDQTATVVDLKRFYHANFGKTEKEKAEEFFQLLDDYIEDRNKEKVWSESYYGQWKTLRNDWFEYKPKIQFRHFSKKVLNGYVDYLAERMCDEKIKEYMKKLREFVRYAEKKGCPVNPEFHDFNPKFQKRIKGVNFLSEQELRAMIEYDFSNQERLERVRDMFIFQCCTGLRYSDLKSLTKANIVPNRETGGYSICAVTNKDHGEIYFELAEIAVKIYEKYSGNVYKKHQVFPIISGAKYREYLAEIGQIIGMQDTVQTVNFKRDKRVVTVKERWKMGTHTARRTFIVQAVNGGATTDQVALLTSHSDVKQMLPYLTITKKTKASVISIIDSVMGS